MSAFEFATATQIIFGAGVLKQVGTLAASFGNRALIMTGHTPGRAAVLLKTLDAAHVAYRVATISEEPTVETVQRGLEIAFRGDAQQHVQIGQAHVAVHEQVFETRLVERAGQIKGQVGLADPAFAAEHGIAQGAVHTYSPPKKRKRFSLEWTKVVRSPRDVGVS